MDQNLQAKLAEKLNAFEQTAKPKPDSNLGKKGDSKAEGKKSAEDNFSLLTDGRSRIIFPACVVAYFGIQLVVLRNAWPCSVPWGNENENETYGDQQTIAVYPFAPWVRYVDLFAAVSFSLATIVNIHRWLLISREQQSKDSLAVGDYGNSKEKNRRIDFIEQRNIYEAALAINVIAATATILVYTRGAFGMPTAICSDAFGIETPAPIWPEYVLSVPMLVYIAISMEQKSSIQREEWLILAAIIFAMCVGIVLLFRPDFLISAVLLSVVFLLLTYVVVMAAWSGVKHQNVISQSLRRRLSEEEQYDAIRKSFAKRYLSWLLTAILPIFPALYLSRLSGFINRDHLAAGFMVASVVAKLVFVASLSRTQSSVFERMTEKLVQEKRSNDTRRAFMRYVFHEVRVPLNTITMGLSLLNDDQESLLSPHAAEAIAMMTGATDFMSDTLNDVLSIHKIEEGAMQLVMQPFRFFDLLARVQVAVRGQCDDKHIKILIDNPDGHIRTLPLLLGDRFRLENVVVNFLSNAVKFSHDGGLVSIFVSVSPPVEEFLEEECFGEGHHQHGGKVTFSPVVGSQPASSTGSRSVSLVNLVAAAASATASVSASATMSRQGSSDQQHKAINSPWPGSGYGSAASSVGGSLRHRKIVRNVTVVVKDNGIGIDKETLERLFVSLNELSLENLRESRGVGFGLILAKEFVNLHGGIVIASSIKGVGSGFGFRIPFEVVGDESIFSSPATETTTPILSHTPSTSFTPTFFSGAAGSSATMAALKLSTAFNANMAAGVGGGFASAAAAAAAAASANNPNDVKTKTALLVDDTPSNCKMLSMLLKKRGMASETAYHGKEAIDLVMMKKTVKNGEVVYSHHLIFMDCHMPIMNGHDATKALRSQGYKGMMIGLTGNAMDEDILEFLDAGVDLVMAKPLRSTELDALLHFVTANGYATQEAGTKLMLRRGSSDGDEVVERISLEQFRQKCKKTTKE